MHYKNQSKRDTGDASGWSAFMVGALIGGGIALLVAPLRGTELRSTVRDYTDRAKDALMEQGRDIFDTAGKHAKESSDQAKQVIRDVGQSQTSRPNRDRRRAGQSIKAFA